MAGTSEDKKVCREAAGGHPLALLQELNLSSATGLQVNAPTDATSEHRVTQFQTAAHLLQPLQEET